MKKIRAKKSLQIWVAILFIGCISFMYTSIDPFGEYIGKTIAVFIIMGAFLFLWGKMLLDTYIGISSDVLIVKAPRITRETMPVRMSVINTNYHFNLNELTEVKLIVDKHPLSKNKSIWKSYVGKGQTTLIISNNRGEIYRINAEGFSYEKLKEFLRNELKGVNIVVE
jgi:hypothetical protein